MADLENVTLLALFREIAGPLFGVDPEQIVPQARFDEDLGADSLGLIEVIAEIETSFGIELPIDALEGVATVGDALAIVERELGQG